MGLKHLEAAGKVFCLLPGSLACLPCSSVVSRTVRLVFGRQRWAPAKTKIGRHPLYCFSPHSILFQNVFDGLATITCTRPVFVCPHHAIQSFFLGGTRGGGLREENSGRDALQSFATALLVAAPQTALSRLPPLLPPAPPGSAAATSSSPLFGRTAPRTRSGTLLSCAASF